jgi:outer membrane murein-binding lipoprotein Lpp
MPTSARRTRRLLAAALASAGLLAGCSAGNAADEAATSSASTSAAQKSAEPDLASGLLTADAFGPSAAVVAMTPEQLKQGEGIAAAGQKGLTITPESCAAAVQGAQPSFDAYDDVAAESATIGAAVTVEVLVRGGPTKDAVSQLVEAAQRCPTATLTSPQIGSATIAFEALPLDELGSGSALLRYTTDVSLPDGTHLTVPALIGTVQDGNRLLVLMNIDTGAARPGAAPAAPQDPAAFAKLLAQAYQVQADALG